MVTNFTALCFSNSRTRSVLFVNKELRRAAQFLPSVAFGSIPSDLIHFSLFLSSLSLLFGTYHPKVVLNMKSIET